MAKALRKTRARDSDVVAEIGDGPRLSRPFVQQSESFADYRIASSSQPSLLVIRQLLDETSQSLDKQHLRQLGENYVPASSGSAGLANRELNRTREPLTRRIIRDIDHEHGR